MNQLNYKQMKKVVFATILIPILSTSVYSSNDIKGTWLTDNGQSVIEIYQKDSTQLVGEIVWMEQSTNEKGEPFIDKKNPNRSLRERPIMGLKILDNLVYQNGKWHGSLYSPRRGRTVDAVLTMEDNNTIMVEVSYRGITRKQIWTRTVVSK
jgi:uncharacterized protein (DUF2147 family)